MLIVAILLGATFLAVIVIYALREKDDVKAGFKNPLFSFSFEARNHRERRRTHGGDLASKNALAKSHADEP
jgi:hypothetical protein